jgi:hypothetical protein
LKTIFESNPDKADNPHYANTRDNWSSSHFKFNIGTPESAKKRRIKDILDWIYT